MIELVDGVIYSIDEEDLSQEILGLLCTWKHQNNVICVTQKNGIKIYINAGDVRNQRIDEECYEIVREDVFSQIYLNKHIDSVVPLLDPEGNPIALARYCMTSYDHVYDCDIQRIDTAVFDLYECVCLCGVNEYSVLIYQQCLNTYDGEIILFGKEWEVMIPYLGKGPASSNILVTADKLVLEREAKNRKTMTLNVFASNVAEHTKRCKAGLFSYDEIMTLLYYFTQHKETQGVGNNRIYAIDIRCGGLGLVSMVNCFDVPCAYLISKGYIPIINIVSADNSIYSDGPGDDIWSKFFKQPTEIRKEDLKNINDVTVSPLTGVTFSGKWLMQQMTHCGAMDLMKPEYFNDRLLQYIEGYRNRILQEPETTLGVLIRGTDYVAIKPKGHAVQATPEQVIEKIGNLSKEEWNFKKIFVATEDLEALLKMQTAFGDRVIYVEQKRFALQKGESIAEQKEKDSWKPGDGWKYGADYLCAMVLLSECAFFIASGSCTGTGMVQKLAKDQQRKSFIFDLGLYE